MNIKNRLMKLEQVASPEQALLLIVKFDDDYTSEQQRQIDEAETEKRQILIVEFV